MVHPAAAVTTTCVPARALSSMVVAGATSSKGWPVQRKWRCPPVNVMFLLLEPWQAVSSEESQESSLHGRATQDSTAKIGSWSAPRGQSSQASLPSFVLRLELEAPLQITAPLDIGGVSILDVTTTVATG
jgi:hypothetical protein